MPVIQNLMKRWGFVKLSRYGLLLTPDGRVLSMRPAVLDDGMGARIVGWEDGDLAAAELQKWEPARPAPAQAVAPRLAMPPRPPVRTTQPVPIAQPAPTPAPAPAPVAIVPVAAPVMKPAPAPVAAAPVVEEDDWEWTIAIARARAAAEEADEAALTIAKPTPRPAAPIVAAPRPLPASAMSGEWPKTEPLGAIDYEDYSTVHDVPRYSTKPTEEARTVAIPPRAVPRAASPATVIPVPKLPSARSNARFEPVVRAAPPRRIAKGTNPVVDTSVTQVMEDTLTNVAAIGDRTRPGIAMPRGAATVSLPKRASR